MNFKSRVRQIWKWAGLIWVVGFVSFMVYAFAVNGPEAQLVQSQLED